MSKITLLNKPKVIGNTYPVSESYGWFKSIDSIDKGLDKHDVRKEVRLCPRGFTIARILNHSNDDLWHWKNLNFEAVKFETDKTYSIGNQELPKGKYFAFVINAETFSHDINKINQAINDKKIINNSMPLGDNYVDDLIGNKQAWVLKDGIMQKSEVPILTTNLFREQSANLDFLDIPAYVALFSIEEATEYSHNDRLPIDDKRVKNHMPSQVISRSPIVWLEYLDVMKTKKRYSKIYVGMPNLLCGAGRGGCASGDNFGFDFDDIYLNGCSVGVPPEAERVLVKAFKDYMTEKDFNKGLFSDIFNLIQDVKKNHPIEKLSDKPFMQDVFNNTKIAEKYLKNN